MSRYKEKASPTMDLDRYVPALLNFISNRLTTSGSDTYRRKFGLGIMEFRIMAMLSIEPDISGARIAEVIHLDGAAVSRTLQALKERGLVRIDQGQGRSRLAALTGKGRKLYGQAWLIGQERERRLVAGFSEEELDTLTGYLRRLLAATADVAKLSEKSGTDGKPSRKSTTK